MFASSLVSTTLPSSPPSLQVRAVFKGNTSGRKGGGAGGMDPVENFARKQIKNRGHELVTKEFLVDFLVSSGGPDSDPLKVQMTVESEARPIASKDDLHDFNKLLMVSSPRRLFLSRVNVTKGGKTDKREEAEAALAERLRIAEEESRLAAGDLLTVVLLQTSSELARIARVATWQKERLLQFHDVAY
jgi:hypothetical protein